MNHKTIFSSNLNRKMEEAEKTRKDICDALGFSYYTVTDWVKGKKMPRMDKIEKLAKYFGCLISDLIEEKTKYDDISNTSLSDYEINIIAMLNKLNKEGQQKAEAYIKDLLGNASYNNELQKKEYTLADYGQIAAEGGKGSRGPNVEEFDIL